MNVLAQTFVARRPNEAWVTDMTYVPTVEGMAIARWRQGSRADGDFMGNAQE
jgi:hypothetical protein